MPDEPNNTPDPAQAFQGLLAKHNNDATAVASKLFDENFQLRTKNRELSQKIPGDGTVTLTADEAKQWNAFKDLGQEPKDIKKALAQLPDLEKQNKELAGMETYRELADLGLDGSKLKLSVLKDQLARFPDAVIRFDKQTDKDGNESKVAFIKTTADGTESSFTDFAAQNLSDYLPALKVTAEQAPPIPGNTQDPKPQGGVASVFDRAREAGKALSTQVKPNIDAVFGRSANAN
jgi:anthranilate/para-aminobenzoate synthase component I